MRIAIVLVSILLLLLLTFLPSAPPAVGLVRAKWSGGGGIGGSSEWGGRWRWRRREALGSRPPRCVNKCYSCSPCTATLVVSPHGRGPTAIRPARADVDGSNYYLLAWKCACGDKLFQP